MTQPTTQPDSSATNGDSHCILKGGNCACKNGCERPAPQAGILLCEPCNGEGMKRGGTLSWGMATPDMPCRHCLGTGRAPAPQAATTEQPHRVTGKQLYMKHRELDTGRNNWLDLLPSERAHWGHVAAWVNEGAYPTATTASASSDIPPPKYPNMRVLTYGNVSECCGYTESQMRAALAGREASLPDAQLSAIAEQARLATDVHCEGLSQEPSKEYSDAYFCRLIMQQARAALAQPATGDVSDRMEAAGFAYRHVLSGAEKHWIGTMEAAKRLAQPAAPVVDEELPPLPPMDCVYADHSYPAYRRKTVEKLYSDLVACIAAARSTSEIDKEIKK